MDNCRIEDYPGIEYPAAVNYMESLGAVVACGGYKLDDSSRCWSFDGSSWTPLPDSTQRHCYDDFTNLIVDNGMWVTGRLQTGDGRCSDELTSEIYTGTTWIPGPQLPAGLSERICLAEVNNTHSLFTVYTSSWLYDWTERTWSKSNGLDQIWIKHGCAVLEGQGVLVAGGDIYSVELYDPETGIWTPQPLSPAFPRI